MESNKIGIKPFFIALGAIAIIEIVARNVIPVCGFLPSMAIQGGIRIGELILLVLIVVIWGKGLSSIGIAKNQLLPGVKKGLLWSFGFGLAVLITAGILLACGINPLPLIYTRLPKQFFDLIVFFIVAGLIGPVAEEVFFRGILYGFLRRWGIAAALLLTTVIFVFLHSSGSVIQAAGGVLFAVSYEIERKLMTPIIIHVLGNMAIFSLSIIF